MYLSSGLKNTENKMPKMGKSCNRLIESVGLLQSRLRKEERTVNSVSRMLDSMFRWNTDVGAFPLYKQILFMLMLCNPWCWSK